MIKHLGYLELRSLKSFSILLWLCLCAGEKGKEHILCWASVLQWCIRGSSRCSCCSTDNKFMMKCNLYTSYAASSFIPFLPRFFPTFFLNWAWHRSDPKDEKVSSRLASHALNLEMFAAQNSLKTNYKCRPAPKEIRGPLVEISFQINLIFWGYTFFFLGLGSENFI